MPSDDLEVSYERRVSGMSWNRQPEVHYVNSGLPYSSSGSFMDFFESLTYEHVNFIFADPPYSQVHYPIRSIIIVLS